MGVWAGGFKVEENSVPFLSLIFRMAQEPNWNQKPESVRTVFPRTERGTGTARTVFRNRNKNPNRAFLLKLYQSTKKTFPPQNNRRNRKPEPLKPVHARTVTEANRTVATRILEKGSHLEGLLGHLGIATWKPCQGSKTMGRNMARVGPPPMLISGAPHKST